MELLPLVCLCLLSCSGDAVRVVVEEDSDAVLPCLIRTKEDISGKYFDWRKDGQKKKKEVFKYDAGVHYNNGLPGQDEQFKGRVSFFQDQLQNGNTSIKITGTKMADSGIYSCDFPRHQPSQTSIIELVVAVRVVVEEGSDAVLPCLIRTKEDISGKLFVWRKDGQKEMKEVFMYDAGIHSQDDQFKGRVSFFEDQLQNGNASIKITRTKMADSGTYSCDFPRHQPSQTSIIELVVDPVLRDRTGENIPAVRVVVEQDSDAVLPCLISPKEDISGKLFHWVKDGQNVFLYNAGFHSQGEQFKGRVLFFEDQLQNGNASIKITRTKMADSGTYSCDFPRHQPRQTSIIELVVGRVLKDRTGENIPGFAPEPCIMTVDDKVYWSLLQCEAHGVPRPTIKWQDSENNIIPAEETKISDRGGRFYITVKIIVTKTGNYRCVATQETLSHQVAAVIPVHIQVSPPEPGSNTGWIVAGVFIGLFVVAAVLAGLYIRHRIKKHHNKGSRRNTANGPPGADSNLAMLESRSELHCVSDGAELK